MGNQCKEFGYIIFVILSFFTYIAEFAMNCTLAYYLFTGWQTVWFVLLLCLMAVPSLTIQLISYQQHIIHTDNKINCFVEAPAVVLHLLQQALPWRYGRLFLSNRIALTSREIWHTFLLRIIHTLFSGLPILFLQFYLILASLDEFLPSSKWYLIASASTSIVSVAWSLATYHKYTDYCCVIGLAPPATAVFIKCLWRIGEIFSRLLTLVLFALVHKYWIFLVIGFHWTTMLLVLIVDQVIQGNEEESRIKMIGKLFLKSYMYIFSHLNLFSKKSKYSFVFFYIICGLESVALLTLWIIYDKRSQYHIPFGIAVAGGYAIALIFALLYYNCFHRISLKDPCNTGDRQVCLHQCVDCKLDKTLPGSSKPWSQVMIDPDPRFFDILQSSDCNSDRSSDVADGNSMQHNDILRLDARMLQDSRAPSNQGNNVKGYINESIEWDRYDMQIRETPEGASLQDSQIKESPRSSTHSKTKHSHQTSFSDKDPKTDTLESPNRTGDQGYFSGISASSKENKRKALQKSAESKQILPHKLSIKNDNKVVVKPDGVHSKKYQKNHHHQHHHHPSHHHERQHSGTGITSDTTNSTFSTTSSKRPILNCERCGHCTPVDTWSVYSMTSTSATSMGSSAYTKRKPETIDRSAVARHLHKHKGAVHKMCAHHAELQMPINTAQQQLYGYHGSSHTRVLSDGTSSGWEFTDSEI